MERRLALMAAVAALAAGCGGGDGDGRFTAQLRSVNDSGVTGSVQLSRDGDLLDVHITAAGLTPNRIHEQRLHSVAIGSAAARCPASSGERLVRGREAEDALGSDVFALSPFPTVGANGRLDYANTVTIGEGRLRSLDGTAVVLAGKDVRRRGARLYAPELPVACGVLGRAGGG